MTASATLQLAAAVARYHAGCLRVIGSQNVAQTDVRTARKAAYPCDVGRLTDRDELFHHRRTVISPPRAPATGDPAARETYKQQLAVWERLRELVLKAGVEAHQKEVIYAGPLLSGVLYKKSTSSCEPVLAPLFLQTVNASAESDGSVVITATDEPPRFNTSVWANAFHKVDADQIVTYGINAQADLAEAWDDDRVEELLRGIQAVFTGLAPRAPDDVLRPWPERLTPAQAAKLQPHLQLHSGAALYLANKSSPYLLADLDRIADHPEQFVHKDRPLSILLSPPADDARPELERLDIHEVVFPFPSNGPQRRVVAAVEENRIVVVQGPPGNGKSLTIANLVAHLVSEGKSVLVSSHKEQALTVVREKLDEMDLPFLYASMVGTSSGAKRALQGQIQDVKGFFAKVNQHELRKQLKEVEQRRHRNGEQYQALRDEFNDRAEAEQAESERLLISIEGVALLPSQDPEVAEGERDRVAADLLRLDQLARQHHSVWEELRDSPIAGDISTERCQSALRAFLELQRARLDAAADHAVQQLVRQWQPVAERQPAEVDAALAVTRAIVETLRVPVAAIDDDPDPAAVRAFAQALAANADLRALAEQAVGTISAAFIEAQALQDHRNSVQADVARRHQVVQQHALLKSFLKKKGARTWLEQHAPGAAGLDAERVSRWAAFWDAWERVRTDGEALGGVLRLKLGAGYDPTTVTTYTSGLRRSLDAAQAVERARLAARQDTQLRLPLESLTADLREETMEREVSRWERALAALGADRSGNQQISDAGELAFFAGRLEDLDAAIDDERYEEANAKLEALAERLAAMPALAERARILQGPAGQLDATVAALEGAAATGRAAPEFLADLRGALAVGSSSLVSLGEALEGRLAVE